MTKRQFTIDNEEGEKLVCIEAMPKQYKGKLPVIILCHGFGYFKEEDGLFTAMSERLSLMGYVVYYFDFSGCGESEGDYSKTTLTKLIGDLKSVYKTVTSYDYINLDRVSLISQSFGSNVIIGAQYMDLEKMAMCGSFTDGYTILSSIFDEFNEEGLSSRESTSTRTRTMGAQFWKDLKNYNMEKLIAKFNFPILFIHGGKDTIVPIKYMEPLLEATRNHSKVILKDSDHNLYPEREKAYLAIEEFFKL
jgi:pimeloyl-ACP methyl ester carboxylesterase